MQRGAPGPPRPGSRAGGGPRCPDGLPRRRGGPEASPANQRGGGAQTRHVPSTPPNKRRRRPSGPDSNGRRARRVRLPVSVETVSLGRVHGAEDGRPRSLPCHPPGECYPGWGVPAPLCPFCSLTSSAWALRARWRLSGVHWVPAGSLEAVCPPGPAPLSGSLWPQGRAPPALVGTGPVSALSVPQPSPER